MADLPRGHDGGRDKTAPSVTARADTRRDSSLREGAKERWGRGLMSLPYNHDLIAKAKQLRNNATPQENQLWYQFLRSYPVRFQRQKTISSFIVDFYCHAAKLVIEIDGSQHYEPQGLAYDEERTAVLSQYGLEVLRFSNADINLRFKAVCDQIHVITQERIKK